MAPPTSAVALASAEVSRGGVARGSGEEPAQRAEQRDQDRGRGEDHGDAGLEPDRRAERQRDAEGRPAGEKREAEIAERAEATLNDADTDEERVAHDGQHQVQRHEAEIGMRHRATSTTFTPGPRGITLRTDTPSVSAGWLNVITHLTAWASSV